MIGDSIDSSGISSRNWRNYGFVGAALLVAIGGGVLIARETGFAAKPLREEHTRHPMSAQMDVPPQRYEIQDVTPPPQMPPPPKEDHPPAGPLGPQRPQKTGNADMTTAFASSADKEAEKYYGQAGSSGTNGGAKQGIGPLIDDGFQTLIDRDDRQGLVAQKENWRKRGVGGDFVIANGFHVGLQGDDTIQAGRAVIEGQMLQTANTDIPSTFFAQVTKPVCDSVTGTNLLIPAGSTIQAGYNSQLSYGQGRMQVSAARLKFYDGSYQDLGGMGALSGDEPGLDADVDRHPWAMAGAIGGAALFSIIGQAGQLIQGDGEQTVAVIGANAAGSQAESIGGKIVNRELQRPNTLRYKKDEPIQILVDKDFRLPIRGRCS